MTYSYDRRTAAEVEAADLGGAKEFIDVLKSHLKPKDRIVSIRPGKSWGLNKEDDVYVNFINLPTSIGAGGGAEAENNRASFWIRGFGADNAPPPTGKVKVEMANSSLYVGQGAPSRETRVVMRAKSGPPAAIAKYLADWINKTIAEVPPNFTHSKPPPGYEAKT